MRKISLLVSILLLFLISTSKATNISDNSGTSAFPFLKFSSGLKAQAMGENFVAVGDGLSTLYYNPAGVTNLQNIEVSAEYILWLDILSKSNLSFVYPKTVIGPIGIGVDYFNVPYEKRDKEDDENFQSASVWMGVFQVSYARAIKGKILVGASIKYITQNLDIQTTNGIAVDIGGIYKLYDKTNIGLALQNLGVELAEKNNDSLPFLLRIGQATKFFQEKLLFVSDINYGLTDGTASIGIGGEYKLIKYFYPRLGYKFILNNNNLSAISGLNLGFGVNYKNINFDYVFSPKDDLGTIHRVAVAYSF